MNRNELSLEVIKSHNLKLMILQDTSQYYGDIENYLVEILPVNKSNWIGFQVNKNFNLVLNSSNLHYKKVGEVEDLLDLPDGIYEFKQSYKPNSGTVVQFYYLRTSALLLKYVELLCKHFDERCEKDKRVYNDETLYLTKIKQYIDAAEFVVSEKNDKVLGIKYYNKAIELIKKIEHGCGC